ncbi:MAG: pilus assembly protein [Selenomonas sp.]|nr:pilus assembly protein [Selenomonas sp.]
MRKGNQSGAVLVLTAILLPILVVATAMVVDFGYGYWQKSKLQSAAAIQGYDTRTRLVTESEVSKDTPYKARFKVTELARVNAEKLVNNWRRIPSPE